MLLNSKLPSVISGSFQREEEAVQLKRQKMHNSNYFRKILRRIFAKTTSVMHNPTGSSLFCYYKVSTQSAKIMLRMLCNQGYLILCVNTLKFKSHKD